MPSLDVRLSHGIDRPHCTDFHRENIYGKNDCGTWGGNAGTTFALLATHNANGVRLWTIEDDLAKQMQRMRENPKYLQG
jgi:hypothetical protein